MRLPWYILLTLPLATASNRGKKWDGWMVRRRSMFCRTIRNIRSIRSSRTYWSILMNSSAAAYASSGTQGAWHAPRGGGWGAGAWPGWWSELHFNIIDMPAVFCGRTSGCLGGKNLNGNAVSLPFFIQPNPTSSSCCA